jgi:hypothetical protein
MKHIMPRKKKGGMHIKESHRGLFTAKAHAAGEGVQQHAQHVLHSGSASGATKKQANFARMAKRHWKPLGS